jgi:hypothetical protein
MANAGVIAQDIVRHLMTPFNGDTDRNKHAWSHGSRIEKFEKAMIALLGKQAPKRAVRKGLRM